MLRRKSEDLIWLFFLNPEVKTKFGKLHHDLLQILIGNLINLRSVFFPSLVSVWVGGGQLGGGSGMGVRLHSTQHTSSR